MLSTKFENYEISELENGIRIISEYIPYFRSISLGIWVAGGSRGESENLNGITHLIEHLVFKGTKKRTNKEIAIEFDSVGADFNAFTDKENSCFHCDFIDTHLDKCAELLFDVVLNPSFLPKNLDTEKKIILEEIKMVEDTPSEDIFNYYYELILNSHPLSLPILGTRQSLQNIQLKDVWEYFNKRFVFKNIVVSAAGNIKHKDLVEAVKKNINKLVLNGLNEKDIIEVKEPEIKSGTKIIKKKIKSANICYGGIGCKRSSPDKYSLTVLMNLVGGSMSSRLFQKIREDSGLAYSVFAGNTQYTDTGVIDIYAATDSKNVAKVIDIINNEINDIKKNSVSEIELERAKENIKGAVVLNIEEISSRMFRFGKSLLIDNKVLPIDKILNKIDSVSIRDIYEISNKYFSADRKNIAILGEVSKEVLKELK
ncbi:MAG: insulinase family protein [Actinobacteria bacterium]|nr:insulinase family protein [Actinomycetota bacterium]